MNTHHVKNTSRMKLQGHKNWNVFYYFLRRSANVYKYQYGEDCFCAICMNAILFFFLNSPIGAFSCPHIRFPGMLPPQPATVPFAPESAGQACLYD